MNLFDPHILGEARELSLGLGIGGIVLGLLLWLTGWWGHRFWIVLTVTVSGGVVGLSLAPLYEMNRLVAGILSAVAAGILALALVRVVVFVAGGLAGCAAAYAITSAAGNARLYGFLIGGLAGLLLFRFWTMVLTSFAGSLLMGYSLLGVLDRLGKINALDWSAQNANLLNGACVAAALAGVLIQFFLERLRLKNDRSHEERLRHMTQQEQTLISDRRRWLDWGKKYRQAG